MLKLFSKTSNRFLKSTQKSELELNTFLTNNWASLFPNFTFISNEFRLDGNVRSKGTSGRIDILAYNPKSSKFVVFELKKDKDKNVRDQASDYRDFIEDNFAEIYLQSTQKYNKSLPQYHEISKESVEVVLIAQKFSQPDIEKAKKSTGGITLIKYFWFEDDLFLIDYLNNDPDDILEQINAEKIKAIKAIIDNKTNLGVSDVDIFFRKADESKELFYFFHQFLIQKYPNLILLVNKHTIRVTLSRDVTFSVIGFTGKSGHKTVLRIDTNIDISSLQNIKYEDRMDENGKLKGSIGAERYQVFLKNSGDMDNFILFLSDRI